MSWDGARGVANQEELIEKYGMTWPDFKKEGDLFFKERAEEERKKMIEREEFLKVFGDWMVKIMSKEGQEKEVTVRELYRVFTGNEEIKLEEA